MMTSSSRHDPDALPQLIGEFQPVDVWQAHINELFYGLRGHRIRDYYQTFATADYRLAYALAEDYYRRLCERDKRAGSARPRHRKAPEVRQGGSSPGSDETSPETAVLTVMEWGCGNGNLAACFLDRLQELDKAQRYYPRVQLIMIDRSETMLAQARQHPELAKHMDRVTMIGADVQDLHRYPDGTVDRIFCNELWSELPTKLLLRKGADVMEEYVRPNLSEKRLAEFSDWSSFVNAFRQKDVETLRRFPDFLDDLIWEREYHKIDGKSLPFRKTVTDFLKTLDEDVLVPVNIGAAATLKEAKRLLAPDAIGFSAFDAGTADRDVLNDPEKPCYSVQGGQFSFIVNLALLQQIAKFLGVGSVSIEPQKEFVGRSLGTNVMSLMDLLASHPRIPNPDSWEADALIIKTIQALNHAYRSPYQRKLDFPLREETPPAEREQLEKILDSLEPNGVPDTVAYVTEDEILAAQKELEALGYDPDFLRAALQAPPQPVDYAHFTFAPTR